MAVVNLAITIPDDQVARTIAAFRVQWNDPAMTQPQAIERLRLEVIQHIKDIVRRVERDAAIAAANIIAPIDAT